MCNPKSNKPTLKEINLSQQFKIHVTMNNAADNKLLSLRGKLYLSLRTVQ